MVYRRRLALVLSPLLVPWLPDVIPTCFLPKLSSLECDDHTHGSSMQGQSSPWDDLHVPAEALDGVVVPSVEL